MRAYGKKKTGKSIEGHQDCGVCHPATKNKTTKARAENKKMESNWDCDQGHLADMSCHDTMTTNDIKKMIPQFVTDAVVAGIQAQFTQPTPGLKEHMQDPKNWARVNKYRNGTYCNDGWCRVFNYKIFDDQLRLYVFTDSKDLSVLKHTFSVE